MTSTTNPRALLDWSAKQSSDSEGARMIAEIEPWGTRKENERRQCASKILSHCSSHLFRSRLRLRGSSSPSYRVLGPHGTFPLPCIQRPCWNWAFSASSAFPIMTNNSTVNPSEVGWQFVPQYYTFVNKHPNRLHCFYNKGSTFIHGTEGEDGKPCFGQQVGCSTLFLCVSQLPSREWTSSVLPWISEFCCGSLLRT